MLRNKTDGPSLSHITYFPITWSLSGALKSFLEDSSRPLTVLSFIDYHLIVGDFFPFLSFFPFFLAQRNLISYLKKSA